MPQTFEELKDADAPLEAKKERKIGPPRPPAESPKKASLMLAKKPGKDISSMIAKQLSKPA